MGTDISFDATYPFKLPTLSPSIELNDEINGWLLKARVQLAELKGYSDGLPNPMLLLSPAILKEAVASSEIENINTTIERVLQQQLFPEAEQKNENKEVIRYKEAVLFGYEKMNKISISSRLIKEIHKILLGDRSYGYRKLQNHIENSETKKIIYTPPLARDIEGLISDWEKYIHTDDYLNDDADCSDPLIKCAISHYQFEAIHPFNDGNGRTGRILMVLYLIKTGILNYPVLFISGYINKNRTEYYNLLQNVTAKKEWLPYIKYMLRAFCFQALETKEKLFELMGVYYQTKEKIKQDCKNIYSSDLVEILFSTPVVTPVKMGALLGVHYTTATRYLKELTEKRFLEHRKVGKYQLYINMKLISILEGEETKISKD